MTEVSRDDLLDLLATRHRMIEPLCDGLLDKQVIQERVDVSRPTVDRAFREFEELGLLESTGTTYEITRFGRLFCDRLEEQLDHIDEMVELASLLSHLPESTSIDDRLLSGAEVIQTDPQAPLSPISQLEEIMTDAEYIIGYSNVVLPHYVNFFHHQVVEEDLDATIILSEGVMDRVLEEYPEKAKEVTAVEGFSFVTSPESLPYGIRLIDGEIVGVAIRDEENRLQGVLVNDSADAVEWAEERLAALEEGGEEFDIDQAGDSAVVE